MNTELETSRRINLRLTPTDRLNIERISELWPATTSDVIRLAIHTAFLLVQCARESLRLVLRNDKLERQESIDISLSTNVRWTQGNDANEHCYPNASATEMLQIRLNLRTSGQLVALVQCGFASTQTDVVRRSLRLHYQVLSKTRSEYRFGTINGDGEFTPIPLLDLVYTENGPAEQSKSVTSSMVQPTKPDPAQPEAASSRTAWQSAPTVVDCLDAQGRYEVVRELNCNALAMRYLARDRRLGRLCIVKVAVVPTNARYEERLRRFETELKLTTSFGDREVLSGVLDAGSLRWGDFELPFMVVDFSSGRTLQDEVNHHGAGKSLPIAIQLIEDISLALGVIHGLNLIHGDLNPRNILVLPSGQIRLIDFGLCMSKTEAPGAMRSIAEAVSTAVPTEMTDFIAPELRAADPVIDPRCDIYSLGVLFRYILGASHLKVEGANLQTSNELRQLIERMIDATLRRYPEDRLQSVDDFCSALRGIEEAHWRSFDIGHNTSHEHPATIVPSELVTMHDSARKEWTERRSKTSLPGIDVGFEFLEGVQVLDTPGVGSSDPNAASTVSVKSRGGSERSDGENGEAQAKRDVETDEELVARWQSGDALAFDLLYLRHAADLRCFLRMRSLGSDRSDDILQQTLLTVVQRIDAYDPNRMSFKGWLFSVARSVLSTSWRRTIAKALDSRGKSSFFGGVGYECFDSLRETERDAIVLTSYGLRSDEVATLLSLSEDTVRRLRSNALEQLRKDMGIGASILIPSSDLR